MKAIRLYGRGDVRLDDVPDPAALGPDEVLVAPLWCGICGTDIREYRGPGGSTPGEPHPLTGVSRPVILGHEFSATVIATGSPRPGISPGTRVAVFPLVGCGRCPACLRGRPVYCDDKAWTGLSTAYGGLGDLAVVGAAQAVPADGMTDQEAALVEPAAVALNAVLRAGVQPGDTVLVTGFGPIGALATLAAFTAGADRVLVSEPRAGLSDLIRRAGAVHTAPGAIPERGVTVAIDCAGKPESLDLCVAAVASGGTICVPSVHTQPRTVDVWRLTRYSLRLTGSLGYTRDVWEKTIALIQAGKYDVSLAHTRTIDRADVAAALDGPAEGLKTLVRVGG